MNKGFSLVELIVVIAIMAILVGVAVPVYTSYIGEANKGVDAQYADELERAVDTLVIDITAGLTDEYKNYNIPKSITWSKPASGTEYLTLEFDGDLADDGFKAALTKLIATDVEPKYDETAITINIAEYTKDADGATNSSSSTGNGE